MKAAIMRRLGKEEKGFTLIELLAVIVILAVIAAIAIPLIGNIINKSKTDSDVSTARQVYDAARLYVTSDLNGTYPATVTVTELQTAHYLDASLVLPSTKAALNGTRSVVSFTNGALTGVTLNTTGNATDDITYTAAEIVQNAKSTS